MSKYSTFAVDRHIEEHENLVHWVIRKRNPGRISEPGAVL